MEQLLGATAIQRDSLEEGVSSGIVNNVSNVGAGDGSGGCTAGPVGVAGRGALFHHLQRFGI